MEQRDEEGRQLSIFPESAEAAEEDRDDPVRKRRAQIRAKVEQKLARPRRGGPLSDAGDVAIPLGATSAAAATAPELDAPLTGLDAEEAVAEELEETPGDLDASAAAGGSVAGLASPAERALSGLIDLGIVSVMFLGLLYLTSQVGGHPVRRLPGSALAALGVISVMLVAGYFLFFWSLSGQTMGQLLTGSRVVSRGGGRLGLKRALLRGLGLVLALLPLGAGLIGLWSDEKRRGWHDRLASTKVIRA